MSEDHWHYVNDIHGAAEEHHRHYDLERTGDDLRAELQRAFRLIHDLENDVMKLRKVVES